MTGFLLKTRAELCECSRQRQSRSWGSCSIRTLVRCLREAVHGPTLHQRHSASQLLAGPQAPRSPLTVRYPGPSHASHGSWHGKPPPPGTAPLTVAGAQHRLCFTLTGRSAALPPPRPALLRLCSHPEPPGAHSQLTQLLVPSTQHTAGPENDPAGSPRPPSVRWFPSVLRDYLSSAWQCAGSGHEGALKALGGQSHGSGCGPGDPSAQFVSPAVRLKPSGPKAPVGGWGFSSAAKAPKPRQVGL
ncbi:PREDICTED: uncharacterized protein LOC106147577 [Chinchilla lanigera]|uniref:uncharacterized protein LOC106147577 n=1 Tax=Chinchilla lanigera TaxID=34839 RepID=UPI00069814F9|nr:PREDICTED: uncharacterized protein LOC106147577 [Chinchilla lanigera]